jgi:hypothetical protein
MAAVSRGVDSAYQPLLVSDYNAGTGCIWKHSFSSVNCSLSASPSDAQSVPVQELHGDRRVTHGLRASRCWWICQNSFRLSRVSTRVFRGLTLGTWAPKSTSARNRAGLEPEAAPCAPSITAVPGAPKQRQCGLRWHAPLPHFLRGASYPALSLRAGPSDERRLRAKQRAHLALAAPATRSYSTPLVVLSFLPEGCVFVSRVCEKQKTPPPGIQEQKTCNSDRATNSRSRSPRKK